jgi:hypothetical protein
MRGRIVRMASILVQCEARSWQMLTGDSLHCPLSVSASEETKTANGLSPNAHPSGTRRDRHIAIWLRELFPILLISRRPLGPVPALEVCGILIN